MGLLDTYAESNLSGLGMSPKADFSHGLIINALHSHIKQHLPPQYVVLQELQIEPANKNSRVPDITIFKKHNNIYKYMPVVFIEIENRENFKKNEKRLKETMKQYNIQEAFLYEYDAQVWHKYYDKEALQLANKQPHYCHTFNIDLAPGVIISGG